MRGPTEKKMSTKLICTGCEVLLSRKLGGTTKFPKTWTVNYCKHRLMKRPGVEITFIKRGLPWTPKWCPELNKGGR